MAAPTGPTPKSNGKGLIPAEWSAQAADTVVDTIDKVRDKTTRPAQVAARGVVFGLLAAVVATIALVLFIVVVLRAYSNWVPGPLWIAYAVLAVIFIASGLYCFSKATRNSEI